jgi:CheY-like chemotaxis protein
MDEQVEILYVEDNDADIELTLAAFQQCGLANPVHIARDGVEALDYLFCRGPHAHRSFTIPKVVLLDLKLPKVDGLEVLRAIRSDNRTALVPVVVLTSSREQRDLVESYELGVNAYMQKPVDFEQFNQTIRRFGYFWLLVNRTPSFS